jgi:hypothetical protein
VELFTSNGPVALVDEIDFSHCLAYIPWSLNGEGYVHAWIPKGKGKKLYLHHFIAARMQLIVPIGCIIDHEDRDRCNNRRDNLRAVTQSYNRLNGKTASTNSSGFKHIFAEGDQWVVRFRIRNVEDHYGPFDLITAIQIRDEHLIRYGLPKADDTV